MKKTNEVFCDRIPAKFRKKLMFLKSGMNDETFNGINTLAEVAANPELMESVTLEIGSAEIYKNCKYMIDTAMMAKELSRQVNLKWSKNRWQEEHDRLSRCMTLKKLSADNVYYQLPEWVKSVKEKSWPGYLISSRRRLGMEGLRQRHCIASWDTRCAQGHNVIASVFLDNKRWTVDIVKPGVCGAIHTRFNKIPTPEQRATIIELLGIKERDYSFGMFRERESCEQLASGFMENHGARLLQLGVETITVWFDGSGDEGHAEYETYTGRPGVTISRETCEAATTLCESMLRSKNIDWYNDEGGKGELTIDLRHLEFDMDVNYRVYEFEDAGSFTLSLNDMEMAA